MRFSVHQIGIIVPDLTSAMDGYIHAFGTSFQVFDVDETMARFSRSSARFRTRFALGQAGGTSIELIQPVSGTTMARASDRCRSPAAGALLSLQLGRTDS